MTEKSIFKGGKKELLELKEILVTIRAQMIGGNN